MKTPNKICGIPIPLAIVAILLFVYIWIFIKPTFLVWRMKKEAAANPRLAMVPVPLSDTSISTSPGKTLADFGYQFEVPWEMKEVKIGSTIVRFESESGQKVIVFFDPANRGPVTMMKDSLGARFRELASLYGSNTIQSNYEFDQAIVYASPAQLSYFLPRAKEVRAAVLLMLKPTEMSYADTGFYAFKTAACEASRTAIRQKRRL